jgi:hypothetical protein
MDKAGAEVLPAGEKRRSHGLNADETRIWFESVFDPCFIRGWITDDVGVRLLDAEQMLDTAHQ